MAHDPTTATIDALDELLEEERAALLAGDVAGMSDMHSRKEALLDKLGRLDAVEATEELRGIHRKLTRNQALLDSALAGIRSVARRLAMVRRVKQSLDYYDEDGAKTSVDIGVERSVEKRA